MTTKEKQDAIYDLALKHAERRAEKIAVVEPMRASKGSANWIDNDSAYHFCSSRHNRPKTLEGQTTPMNDADIEMAQLEETARHESALKRRGICAHGWRQGYTPTHRPDLKPGQIQCLDCKVIFESEEDANEARTEALI